ncbi:unnamed protein product [Kuraishia capsulata CBS 1993]|uniref:GRIP domain-containing protein n=1 Tax=Kuraishia capsulata CBS 1993 TaxID=1382522 RepID=W6MNR1_9ASCO|nr:uncharacterized protein KUCA_T00004253001 [Kuraishia capsulata CBS 1993]CDK28271.1 unnamed protein product [Kuraishia capsulata CBS 1993]
MAKNNKNKKKQNGNGAASSNGSAGGAGVGEKSQKADVANVVDSPDDSTVDSGLGDTDVPSGGVNGSVDEKDREKDDEKDSEKDNNVVETSTINETADPANVPEPSDHLNLAASSAQLERIQLLEQQLAQLSLQLAEKSQETDLLRASKAERTSDTNTTIRELQEQLRDKTEESERHEADYKNLLGRLSSMKSVFSKMKEAQSELEESKERISQLDTINGELTARLDASVRETKKVKDQLAELQEETNSLNSECDRWSKDLSKLRREFQTKDDEWNEEKQQLVSSRNKLLIANQELKSEHEELVIMLNEEKMTKQNFVQEISDLKATVAQLEANAASSDGVKDAISEQILQVREQLRESIEKYESEISLLKETIVSQKAEIAQKAEARQVDEATIARLETEVARISGLESDIKERQIQIGKLRHENVVLNEHLTKALRLIKKDSNTEQVDRELVSNLFISFLSLPRADTKKFEVLQLISNFLNWDDDKKMHAGLIANPNAKSANGKHSRTPSASNILMSGGPVDTRSDSFVSLWTEFLEKETS